MTTSQVHPLIRTRYDAEGSRVLLIWVREGGVLPLRIPYLQTPSSRLWGSLTLAVSEFEALGIPNFGSLRVRGFGDP